LTGPAKHSPELQITADTGGGEIAALLEEGSETY
jgi:hypothetical protein